MPKRVLANTHFEAFRAAGHGRKYVVRVHGAQDEVRSVPFLAAEPVGGRRRAQLGRGMSDCVSNICGWWVIKSGGGGDKNLPAPDQVVSRDAVQTVEAD